MAHISRRSKRYGLTEESYKALLKFQQGRCCGCGLVFSGKRVPHIDHSHDTGLVRGLLCGNCNTGLGLLQDSARNIGRLIEYLRMPPANRLGIHAFSPIK